MTSYELENYIRQAKRQNDEKYWKNYAWLKEHSEDWIAGWYFKKQMNILENNENERYWNDYFRNTGANRSRVKYPIRAGLYNSVDIKGTDVFEASQAVTKLYKKWW